jgi:hypothetical protein
VDYFVNTIDRTKDDRWIIYQWEITWQKTKNMKQCGQLINTLIIFPYVHHAIL